MSIEENVKIGVRADTAQARAAFAGLERGVASFSDKLHSTFAKLNQWTDQIGNAFAHLQRAMDLGKFAADMRQLEASLPIKSMHALQVATDGTVSKVNLMRFAARNMHSDLRLTEAGMQMVLKAADALNARGLGETIAIADKLTHALKTGATRQLGELGIQVDKASGRQGVFNALIEKYKELASDSTAEDSQAQRFEQLQTRIADALDAFRRWLGNLVLAAAQHWETLLRTFSDMWHKFTDPFGTGPESGKRFDPGKLAEEQAGRENPIWAVDARIGWRSPEYDARVRVLTEEYRARNRAHQLATADPELKRLEEMARQSEPMAGPLWEGEIAVASRGQRGGGGGGRRRQAAEPRGGWGFWTDMFESKAPTVTGRAVSAIGSEWSRLTAGRPEEERASTGPSDYMGVGAALEDIEKKQKALADFRASLQDLDTTAGAVYQTAQGATAAMIEAVIEGQGGVLNAVRRSIAGQMKAQALNYAAKAIGFAAEALAGNPLAWAAAGKSAAAAAAFVAGARILGDSGGGGAAPQSYGPAGGGYVAPRASSGGGQSITVIQVGDAFGDRKKAAEAIETARREAKRSGRIRDGKPVVEFR